MNNLNAVLTALQYDSGVRFFEVRDQWEDPFIVKLDVLTTPPNVGDYVLVAVDGKPVIATVLRDIGDDLDFNLPYLPHWIVGSFTEDDLTHQQKADRRTLRKLVRASAKTEVDKYLESLNVDRATLLG